MESNKGFFRGSGDVQVPKSEFFCWKEYLSKRLKPLSWLINPNSP